jgi:NAD+-dependent secondary alcohol dehydrogenase Adh1
MMLTHTYPLDAVNEAMDDLDAGRLRRRGRCRRRSV